MYAVIETGGKQYRVCQGDKIKVEKLDIKEGEKVTFDKVLVISDNGIKVGKPYLEGAKVEGKVLLQAKDKKVVVYKYKAKKNQRNKKGHRQPFSLVEIENIG
ncbi:50S ribosomal protein L21 [Peptoniphilus lacrimalis]|uniref:Large ribosomal subunit protein bL21 n=1 Tax=Peptoniphilus lacrimalis 315-B TaxID=596330 RepID=D1VUN8_9FIRM|nr:50S ribosomal protein L21 [Peptoniphilus lacrimalis]EFA89751.1 ribosomal protein L21 [Peptoniphilus lacrimalis 315-B]KGF29759.1 50S ribosomal protein L21 [Peptoniphilus lacrimalis DNF00528]